MMGLTHPLRAFCLPLAFILYRGRWNFMNVRKIDDLGRVVIPGALRDELGWELLDDVEIYREDDTLVIRLHTSEK